MKIYLNCTANLGDFVQSLPVLSGVVQKYGKVDFVIRHEMRKFKGIKEFLMYQNLFNSVEFDEISDGKNIRFISRERKLQGSKIKSLFILPLYGAVHIRTRPS